MRMRYRHGTAVLCRITALFLFWGIMAFPARAEGLNVQTHTQEEIQAYIENSGADISDEAVYSRQPTTSAPYDAGELSAATQKSALDILNRIRYIAGIDADVNLDNSYCEMAQAGMLLNMINNQLSHYPVRPSGMSDNLYNLGASGAGSSNIGRGYSTLGQAIVFGWMEDGDSSNIAQLGHRRWLLNPGMAKTGFGRVGSYSAMYALDRSRTSSYSNVAWPAQNMPIEYFNTKFPWSVSTGKTETASSVHVKLVRQRDKKTWNFSSSSADGYFSVDNGGYGTPGCIIFRPNNITSYSDEDIFDVTITGTSSGTINYTVRFFALKPIESIKTSQQSLTLSEDTYTYLGLYGIPSNISPDITWESSDNSIVTISGDYNSRIELHTLKAGSAVITASCRSGGRTLTAQCKVTVNHMPGIRATCTTGQYCTRCNILLTPPSGHTWNDGIITKKPTYTATGVKTYTCKICRENRTESIPMLEAPALPTAAQKGTVLKSTVSGGVYRVTASGSAPSVAYTGPVSSKKKVIVIPASIKVDGVTYKVTSIAAGAFKGNTRITKVTIGKNVTSIGSKAFYGCKNLKTVTMGNAVKTINDKAFYKCTVLKKITVPSKVSKIGKQAFYGCKNLKTVTIKSTLLSSKKVGTGAFKGIYSKASVKTPKGKAKSYKKMLQTRGLSKKATVK